MPRTACTECRTRKVKCFLGPIGQRCERCKSRDLRCSMVSLATSPGRGHGSSAPAIPRATPGSQTGTIAQPEAFPHPVLDEMPNTLYARFDIGNGTAAEILREGDLTRRLLVLYFDNFSDIHFMFDQETFLREFALGDVPKATLYTMMALGIRYLPPSLMEHTKRSHRGEILYAEARKLLKLEFDHASLTIIRVYILMSTYHLTFGGAKKAWLHLGMACNMINILKLTDDYWEADPFNREMIHRLICTVLVMDWTLSPSLNAPSLFPTDVAVARPCSDEELKLIKSRRPKEALHNNPPSLTAEILALSRMFYQVCIYHRKGGTFEAWQSLEAQCLEWHATMHEDLTYNSTNLAVHMEKGSLRRFAWFHLLHHHVCQLIYFPFLQGNGHFGQDLGLTTLRVQSCHYHATRITDIVDEVWRTARFDVHNVAVGQMLTIAAAVHTHACLTSTSKEEAERIGAKLTIIDDYLVRVRKHCRVFDWISAQVDAFYRVCSQSSLPQSVFDKNDRLIRHILHYGTHYEHVDLRNGDRITGALETPTPPEPFNVNTLHNNNGSGVAHNHLDWLTSNEMVDRPFEDFAWMYSLNSLSDLYSAPFADPSAFSGGL